MRSRPVATWLALLGAVAALGVLAAGVAFGWHAVALVVLSIALGIAAARVYLYLSLRHRFDALAHLANEAVVVLDDELRVLYASPSADQIFGMPLSKTVRLDPNTYVHPDDIDAVVSASAAARRVPDGRYQVTFRVRHPDDGWRWVEVAGHNLIHDPRVGGVVSTVRDVDDQKQLEARLQHQADHDELTSLPSRKPLIAYLEVALVNNRRFGGRVAALFLDVDRFKVVNDSLGHQTGDRLLVEFSCRLRAAIRPQDRAGRFGGDEFVVILPDVEGPNEVVQIADRVRRAVGGTYVLGEEEVFVSASVGVALAVGGECPEELLRDADAAMYEAKERGRDRVQLFDGAMRLQVVERLDVEQSLRRALERGELTVHYQPVVDLSSHRITGVEALVRWQHPERGLLLPGQFLAVAEETGLIVDIGKFVLWDACSRASTWSGMVDGGTLPVFVNLSARQLADAGLVGDVKEVIDLTGVEPSALHFEITEDALMVDTASTTTTLVDLRSMGVQLAIDDFGTGYSSLSYLKHFPVNALKIDKTFIDGVGSNAGDAAITAAIVEVAQRLGLVTVAEGIERVDQAEWLAALGCDYGQGYHYARPMPGDDVSALLASGSR